jgi:hypothetical protein
MYGTCPNLIDLLCAPFATQITDICAGAESAESLGLWAQLGLAGIPS